LNKLCEISTEEIVNLPLQKSILPKRVQLQMHLHLTNPKSPGTISTKCDAWLKVFVLVALFQIRIPAEAQFLHKLNTANLMLEGRFNYGFLINHHLEMQVFNAHFMSFEINLGRETYGKNRWEAMYAYPIVGLSYWYSNLGNSAFIGKANALFPYINFPLTQSQKYELNFRLGGGLGYLTKHFDRLNNYKYLAIGSHVNAAINLMFEIRWKPIPRTQVSAGIAMMHFSNGSLKTPNYGINIPSANISIAYHLTKANSYINHKMLPDLTKFEFDGHKNIELDMVGAFGMKDISEYGKRYYVYTFSGNIFKTVSYKSKVGIGADLFYDESDLHKAELDQIYLQRNSQIMKPGVNLGYQLNLSRTSFITNLGFYLGGKMARAGASYYKIGMRVMLSRSIFASLMLKTHFARADYIGLGLGYKLNLIYY